jgi:hypothetical protein
VATVPADSDPLARAPARDVGADRVDDAGHFVTGHARKLDARPDPSVVTESL